MEGPAGKDIDIHAHGQRIFTAPRASLHAQWAETSYRMQRARDNPACAEEAYNDLRADTTPMLTSLLTFDPTAELRLPGAPRVAVLREQGVNGHAEMAWAFHAAGFRPVDVHMSDLIAGAVSLDDFTGLVACGGFSYGDVLGAGGGWANCILHHPEVRSEFARFLGDAAKFALGVCNGCQMLSHLKELIPGADTWPRFVRNTSEQFEARYVQVGIPDSNSIFFRGMAGSRLPVVVSHGEGHAAFGSEGAVQAAVGAGCVALQYVDGEGVPTQRYPTNPNASPLGITGLTNRDGRVTIMMPHPERCARTRCCSWHPEDWPAEASPWMQMFLNARRWVG